MLGRAFLLLCVSVSVGVYATSSEAEAAELLSYEDEYEYYSDYYSDNDYSDEKVAELEKELAKKDALLAKMKMKLKMATKKKPASGAAKKKPAPLPLCENQEKKEFPMYCKLAQECSVNARACRCTACTLRKVFVGAAITDRMRTLGFFARLTNGGYDEVDPYVKKNIHNVQEMMSRESRRSLLPLVLGLKGVPSRALGPLKKIARCDNPKWFYSQCRMKIPSFKSFAGAKNGIANKAVEPRQGIKGLLRDFGMGKSAQLLFVLDRWGEFNTDGTDGLTDREWNKAKDSMALHGDAREKFLALAASSLPNCRVCEEKVAREAAAATLEDLADREAQKYPVARARDLRAKICALRGGKLSGSLGIGSCVSPESFVQTTPSVRDVALQKERRDSLIAELDLFYKDFSDMIEKGDKNPLLWSKLQDSLHVFGSTRVSSQMCGLEAVEEILLKIEKFGVMDKVIRAKWLDRMVSNAGGDKKTSAVMWSPPLAHQHFDAMLGVKFSKDICISTCKKSCLSAPPPSFSRGMCSLFTASDRACADVCNPFCEKEATSRESSPVVAAYVHAWNRCSNPSHLRAEFRGNDEFWPQLPRNLFNCEFTSQSRNEYYKREVKKCNGLGFSCSTSKAMSFSADAVPETKKSCLLRSGFDAEGHRMFLKQCVTEHDLAKCENLSKTFFAHLDKDYDDVSIVNIQEEEDSAEEKDEVDELEEEEDEMKTGSIKTGFSPDAWCGEDCSKILFKLQSSWKEKWHALVRPNSVSFKKFISVNFARWGYSVPGERRVLYAGENMRDLKKFVDDVFLSHFYSQVDRPLRHERIGGNPGSVITKLAMCRENEESISNLMKSISPLQEQIESCLEAGRSRFVASCSFRGGLQGSDSRSPEFCKRFQKMGLCRMVRDGCEKTCKDHDACVEEWRDQCRADKQSTRKLVNCNSKKLLDFISNHKGDHISEKDISDWKKTCEKGGSRRQLVQMDSGASLS